MQSSTKSILDRLDNLKQQNLKKSKFQSYEENNDDYSDDLDEVRQSLLLSNLFTFL